MIKATIKKTVRGFLNFSYHLDHKKRAFKILDSIESVKGKTDSSMIKLSNDYAADILGWKGYAPWLYVYCAINNNFMEGWIPDNYYGKIIVPKLKGDYGAISDYKGLAARLFNSPQFPDCAYYSNGLWLSPRYQVLSEKNLAEIVFEKNQKVVFKVDNSLQGNGIYFFDKNNFDLKKIAFLGNGVLQRFINQHSFFQEIAPNSVATLRLTSFIDSSGIVSVRACYLRVGRIMDSHVRSASHIRIPVNIQNGFFDKYGYTTTWLQTEKHPDTNFLFEKRQIPSFPKFLETAINLHAKVPFARIIGWDMILDEGNNVQVMEWNGFHNDIKFSEATQGPCFSGLGFEKLWRND